MEPDPLPEPNTSLHLEDTQITKKDIETILGVSKKRTKRKLLYLFSKNVIIVVATITTFIYFSFHYFGLI